MKILINDVLFVSDIVNTFSTFKIFKLTIYNPCKVQISYKSQASRPGNLGLLLQLPLNGVNFIYTRTGEIIYTFTKAGDYYVLGSSDLSSATEIYLGFPPFTITVSTYCDNYCVNKALPSYKLACSTCGNGIWEET